MTKVTEKSEISRETVNKLAEKFFPNLSEPALIQIALQFELSQ